MNFDLIIIGAGPAGLSMVRALRGTGLRIAVVEQQDRARLADPADDGREIALTHRSQRLMQEYGLWQRLQEHEVSALRDAKVLDGSSVNALMFRHQDSGHAQLGWLVPNHAIRRVAFAEVEAEPQTTFLLGKRVANVSVSADAARVTLDDGQRLESNLLIGADNRFSESRRAVGIAATMRDFGKTMMVCRMRHELEHQQTAWEWFDYGQTLALLPLRDPTASSVVLTLPHQQVQRIKDLDAQAFGAEMTRRFQGRLGAMTPLGTTTLYPLVAVYAERFVAERFALIGDAAVGMHPVTAHGFNFGLHGVDTLARELRAAQAAGKPIWSRDLLQRYERQHRAATRPLYLATQLLAGLYTDDRLPARVLRKFALGAAEKIAPFKHLVMAGLADDGTAASPLRRLPDVAARLRALRKVG